MRYALFGPIVLACLGVLGCERASRPNLRFSLGFNGELRYMDGKPAPPCRVRFIPFESFEGFVGVEAEGESTPSGSFTLKTLGANRIFPGRYKVVLKPLTEVTTGENNPSPIPQRYRQFETTDLVIDVSSKARHVYLVTIKRE
jgi:hypothetical protein